MNCKVTPNQNILTNGRNYTPVLEEYMVHVIMYRVTYKKWEHFKDHRRLVYQ